MLNTLKIAGSVLAWFMAAGITIAAFFLIAAAAIACAVFVFLGSLALISYLVIGRDEGLRVAIGFGAYAFGSFAIIIFATVIKDCVWQWFGFGEPEGRRPLGRVDVAFR